MIEIFSVLSGYGPTEFLVVFAIFCRIGAAAALLPGFGEQVVPARIKLSGALAFTVILIPLIWDQMLAITSNSTFTRILFSETIIGLAIGLFFRLILVVLQIAGAIAAQSTSLSQIFGAGLGSEPQAAFSTLLVVSGLALAASLGLHVQLTQAFLYSYDLFPPLAILDPSDVTEWGVSHISKVFSFGFSLAAPFIIAAVIYNFGLGVINRAMPQLMVAMVGAPAISLGGLIILFAAGPLILGTWMNYLTNSMSLEAPNL
jgi:flagellar biosynthetic protein FliR